MVECVVLRQRDLSVNLHVARGSRVNQECKLRSHGHTVICLQQSVTDQPFVVLGLIQLLISFLPL